MTDTEWQDAHTVKDADDDEDARCHPKCCRYCVAERTQDNQHVVLHTMEVDR